MTLTVEIHNEDGVLWGQVVFRRSARLFRSYC